METDEPQGKRDSSSKEGYFFNLSTEKRILQAPYVWNLNTLKKKNGKMGNDSKKWVHGFNLKNKPKTIQEIQRGLDIENKVFRRHAQKHWGLKEAIIGLPR